MVTVRCTQKLLRRLRETKDTSAPTTVLGDWYANILFSKPQQLVLCVSERSLLPVVVLAKEFESLGVRLSVAVREVLLKLGVAPALVNEEQKDRRWGSWGKGHSLTCTLTRHSEPIAHFGGDPCQRGYRYITASVTNILTSFSA